MAHVIMTIVTTDKYVLMLSCLGGNYDGKFANKKWNSLCCIELETRKQTQTEMGLNGITAQVRKTYRGNNQNFCAQRMGNKADC